MKSQHVERVNRIKKERQQTHDFVATIKDRPANPCRCPSAAGVSPVKSNIDQELERYWHPNYSY